jgi:hypothetical protein
MKASNFYKAPLRWRKKTAVGIFLTACFLLSAFLGNLWSFGPDMPNNHIVMPIDRIGRIKNPIQTSVLDLHTVTMDMRSETRLKPEEIRMNSSYIANPFGALNLKATVRDEAFEALELEKAQDAKIAKPKAALIARIKTTAMAATPLPPPTPPAPTAPPLPFTAFGAISGKRISEGQTIAFLQLNGEILSVKKGDLIGTAYRVESITSERVEVTYLPLQQRQTLLMAQ